MKIGILPIDNRPCNFQFVNKLNKVANLNIELDILPKQYSGEFFKPADINKIREFLIGNSLNWNYCIISLDMLCFGGLIQARSYAELDINHCMKQIDILKQMKQQNPDLKIYAYSVIMRLTISVTGTSGIENWENIFEYSKLKYLNDINPSIENENKLTKIIQKIPSEVLDEYTTVRQRNHLVNCEAINLVNQGVIEFLDCCQEDSQPNGIQKIEHDVLYKLINKNVVLRNGTDEEVIVLYARIVNDILKAKPSFKFLLPNKYEENIALYEDRTTWENITKCVESVDGIVSQDEADIKILTSEFPDLKTNYDMCFDLEEQVLIANDSSLQINNHLNQADAFLDIAFANGGNPYTLENFLSNNEELKVYSAWNTATNAIGTIIATCSIMSASKNYNKEEANKFLHERIIDDCLYQGKIRSLVNKKLVAEGIDVWNFDQTKKSYCDELVNKLIKKEYRDFCEKHNMDAYEINCYFPWTRTFEIEVIINE